MLHLSPHVFAVALGSDLALLDVSSDRYLALPGAAATSGDPGGVTVHPDMSLLEGAAQVLLDADYLRSWPNRDVHDLPCPTASLLRPGCDGGARPRVADLLHLGIALVQATKRFRRGMPLRRYSSKRSSTTSVPEAYVARAASRYRTMKLFVPTPRRCLPDAVIGALFLRRLGIEVEIVFGVRSHPFEAHCWLERDGVVLDDHLERVIGYAPIAVAIL